MSNGNKLQKHQSQIVSRTELWQGPVPPPAVLNDYNAILPGAMERILAMAEREAAFRQTSEAAKITNETLQLNAVKDDAKAYRSEVRRGQYLATIIMISGIAATVFCAYIKQPWIAAVLGSGTLGNVVISMLNAKGKQQ